MKSARNFTTYLPRSACLLDLVDHHDLDLNVGLDGDGSDLLHGLWRRVQVDDALVHTHLPTIPGVGSLSARRLADGEPQNLGGHADRTANTELLVLGTLDEIGANLTRL